MAAALHIAVACVTARAINTSGAAYTRAQPHALNSEFYERLKRSRFREFTQLNPINKTPQTHQYAMLDKN